MPACDETNVRGTQAGRDININAIAAAASCKRHTRQVLCWCCPSKVCICRFLAALDNHAAVAASVMTSFCRRLFGLAPATSFHIDCYD
jgi:hypothetical protein